MTRTKTPTRTVLSLSVLALVITGAGLFAGPLDPPLGPVTSTGKTLGEVEPRVAINAANTPGDADSLFKITQPGSYYLTGNITGVAAKHGIEIAASGVTLDLNGFELAGVAGSLDGVANTITQANSISVRNGSVRGWGGDGVDLQTFYAVSSAMHDLRAHANSGNGLAIGESCTVLNCSAYGNGGNGYEIGAVCIVSNCTAENNLVVGINAAFGCAITNCDISLNAGSGISAGTACIISGCTVSAGGASGIVASSGCTISGCSARSNFVDGIVVVGSCVVLSNHCVANGAAGGDGAGIHATGTRNRIEGNTCISADRGIDVDLSGNIIIKNTCSNNTSSWEIAIGNSFGPIVVAGTNAAAISGNGPVASNLGSTDPNANFTY